MIAAVAEVGEMATCRTLLENSGAEIARISLKRIAEQNRPFAAKADGAKAEKGDNVTIDFTGSIDGKPFEGGTKVQIEFVLESHGLPPGLLAPLGWAITGKVRDVNEFLMELGPIPPQHPLRMKATYHDACHLCHGQKITAQPRQLLRAIKGLNLVELPESTWCCGSAGIYNIIREEMANELDAEVGDPITVFYNNTPLELGVVAIAKDSFLSGVRRSPSTGLVTPGMVMRLDALQEYTDQQGFLSAIAISNDGAVATTVKATFDGYSQEVELAAALAEAAGALLAAAEPERSAGALPYAALVSLSVARTAPATGCRAARSVCRPARAPPAGSG